MEQGVSVLVQHAEAPERPRISRAHDGRCRRRARRSEKRPGQAARTRRKRPPPGRGNVWNNVRRRASALKTPNAPRERNAWPPHRGFRVHRAGRSARAPRLAAPRIGVTHSRKSPRVRCTSAGRRTLSDMTPQIPAPRSALLPPSKKYAAAPPEKRGRPPASGHEKRRLPTSEGGAFIYLWAEGRKTT